MLLRPDPSLAEVPGFSREQLDALARSVELRRQQLEKDIQAYIQRKQLDLRSYEQEVHSARLLPVTCNISPEEKAKQKKHTRVHKREQELYGLVTPVFLPLLDARDTSPSKKKKEKKLPKVDKVEGASTAASAEQPLPERETEKSKESRKSRRQIKDSDDAMSGEPTMENHQPEATKKLKRSAIKKSSLRHNNTPRARRKRVSLVIDGQTVLPADTVIEPPLMSPSSEATSASNSTTSLDDLIDPQLTRHEALAHVEHHDAVHHSLPIPLSNHPLSPTKPLTETPASYTLDVSHSPPLPSPNDELAEEQHWDTYVGGLHGSGVDNVDQAGSYGYPSSLGASYLESYMQGRPLSVRMQAVDKAGLQGNEKTRMMAADHDDKEKMQTEDDDEIGVDIDVGRVRDMNDDDMDIVGSMEGF
ncbi:hypothetical protein BKA66DRAFT_422776 [Pyrenochaeta sp. MPI-SDFR-AT-0127]|nr:hypothetical protein BKA66DRAFT_422776 [Pyrenochaeta sp. MPI-SDFR-AT-0127]